MRNLFFVHLKRCIFRWETYAATLWNLFLGALSLYLAKSLYDNPNSSDSVNAQLWIRQKKCKTKLQRNAKNDYLFQLVERAENWLNNNAIEVPILKWKTEIWGEIPADYGRK